MPWPDRLRALGDALWLARSRRGRPRGSRAPALPKREDIPYLRDLNEAMLVQSTPGSTAMLVIMALTTVAAITWASLAEVDEMTRAEVRVIPSSREQMISSLEGGVLAELLVAEGDIVDKDQPLARLDPTRFRAQYREGLSRMLSLQATAARLRAEASGSPLAFPPEVAALPQLVGDETAAYQARRRSLEEALQSLRRSASLLAGEVAVAERLSAQGLYSTVELSRLQRQATELQQQMAERRNRYVADANAELLRVQTEIAQLGEGMDARRDTLDRTVLRAPVRGVVKAVRANTIGGSVGAGAPILELVPLDENLLFEARLRPSDIAYIRPGLPATIKLSAYDSTIFGDLRGTVELVSPDTFRDDPRGAAQPSEGYYRLIVRTPRPVLRTGEREWPVIPGMTGHVQVRTGSKTIMHYLLKPMTKAREAFRER